MKKIMKVMKEEKIPLNSPILFERLADLLKDQKLYTTLYISTIETSFIQKFDEVRNDAGSSRSSLFPCTKTTSTSCMTVPTMKEDADVNSLEFVEHSGTLLDELLGVSNGCTIDGLILPYISRQIQDQSVSLKSMAESGFEVLKLRFIRYNQVFIKKIINNYLIKKLLYL